MCAYVTQPVSEELFHERRYIGKERNHDCEMGWYRVSNTDTCLEDRYVIKEGIRTPS